MTRRLTILAALATAAALGILPAAARPGDAPEAGAPAAPEAGAPAAPEAGAPAAPEAGPPADPFDDLEPAATSPLDPPDESRPPTASKADPRSGSKKTGPTTPTTPGPTTPTTPDPSPEKAPGPSAEKAPESTMPAPAVEFPTGEAPADPGRSPEETPAAPARPTEMTPIDLPARPAEAKRDEEVERVQDPPAGGSPSEEVNPLGPAKEAPGQAAMPPESPAADPFVLRADQVKAGPNAVALTVEVQAPSTFNVQLPMTLQVHVRNTGKGDAFGVRVRYMLAEGLEYLDSEPKEARRDGPLIYWQLETLAKGAERVVKVRVRPTTVGQFDHAATVSLMTGGRASTLVKRPELKVEMATSPASRVLRGQPVLFTINVTNPGTGPARDVVLKAHLGPGLKHPAGQEIELPLADLGRQALGPGEHEVVELEVLSVAEGEQSCEVVANSPDVPAAVTARQAVTVVEPKLAVKLSGPSLRFPDTVAVYQLTVVNPGTATARRVRVFASVPQGGRLESLPEGATWNKSSRWLGWKLADLEPNRPVVLSFAVKMGGIQFYKVDAQAEAAGPLKANDTFSTSVTGMPDVRFAVSEPRRVIDVGQESIFEVRLKNHGTKEAGHLNLKGQVSEQLQVVEVLGADGRSLPAAVQAPTGFAFPAIERLAAGAEQVLSVRVKGLKKGFATCHVELTYDGTIQDGTIQIDQTASVHVTDATGGR